MIPHYQIYGQILASDFPFKTPLLPGKGEPDISFSQVFSAPDYQEWHIVEPTIQSSNICLYNCPAYDVFHFVEVADFYVFPEKVICHLHDRNYDYQVEVLFLGLIFSYWLEKRGIRALHAAAVNLNGQGIAFLSANSGGKSSLAATLTQMGYPLLTDDILPIQQVKGQYICHSSFPQIRMWPEVAQHFVGSYQDLELAHPLYDKRRVPVARLSDFCTEAIRLTRIYVPDRRSEQQTGTRLEVVPPVQAVLDLIANSFAANVVKQADLMAQRFLFFGGLVQVVPVYKLTYPDGLQQLRAVCQKIIDWNDA